MTNSRFVTTELLDEILAEHREAWTQKHIIDEKRVAVVIIVLDPSKPPGISQGPIKLWDTILGESNRVHWPSNRDWYKYAYAKARAAWRTGMSNHTMLLNPEVISHGDFLYPGGINVSGGLVIAVSGLAKATQDIEFADEFHDKIESKVSALYEECKAKVNLDDDSTFFF